MGTLASSINQGSFSKEEDTNEYWISHCDSQSVVTDHSLWKNFMLKLILSYRRKEKNENLSVAFCGWPPTFSHFLSLVYCIIISWKLWNVAIFSTGWKQKWFSRKFWLKKSSSVP